MNTISSNNPAMKIRSKLFGLLTFSLFIFFQPVNAEPYLAYKTGQKCMACHVNPIGGGMRTQYGATYGVTQLPSTPGKPGDFDMGGITGLRLGGDLRFNADFESPDKGEDTKTFQTQSGQLYVAIQPKGSRFTLYLDEQVAPGGALNREFFVMANLGGSNYLKAGKIMLPYGIRLEDDSAFIRQAAQINFDNADNGVELGLEYNHATVNVHVSNGTTSLSNDDNKFQVGVRGVYIGDDWRVGGSAIHNDADLGARDMLNIFGAWTWNRFTFLAEVDRIEDDSIENVVGHSEQQIATLFEINTELQPGYNLKFTTEYLDPDDNIDEDEKTRHSILLEYTPLAHLQLRGGVRSGDGIPQSNQDNFTNAFVQLHMYF